MTRAARGIVLIALMCAPPAAFAVAGTGATASTAVTGLTGDTGGAKKPYTPPVDTTDTLDTGVTTPFVDTLDTGSTTTPPAETGDTGVFITTFGDTSTIDSGEPYCTTCLTAADLAGEGGGSPCENGCSTGAGGAALAWLLPLVVLYRRSYST